MEKQVIFGSASVRSVFFVGLAACGLSLAALNASLLSETSNSFGIGDKPYSWICFGIAALFFVAITIHNISDGGLAKIFEYEIPLYRIAVTLFTISSFALSHEMDMLGNFTLETGVYLHLVYAALILDVFAPRLPQWLNFINLFLIGAGVVITMYFFVILSPIMPLAIALFFFFGISLHAVSPLFSLIAFFSAIRNRHRHLKLAFAAGIIIPLIYIGGFMLSWGNAQREFNKIVQNCQENGNADLPLWVNLSQYLPEDGMMEKVLGLGTNYVRLDGFGMDMLSSGRGRIHDPLMTIANVIFGEPKLDEDTRWRAMAARKDLKHEMQRHLWGEENLFTESVESRIEVYPEYRLAYTEKIMEVRHSGSRRGQEEAVYTFRLPEGSVATSLSLWINGKEEKARFSSRKKADAAYTRIVGRERRDPAILHWQEGNSLVVSVFPVSPNMPRKFKVGVTTPLKQVGNNLVLESIWFRGPNEARTKEVSELKIIGGSIPGNIQPPDHFDQQDERTFVYQGQYSPYWEFSTELLPISPKAFAFEGQRYTAAPYIPELRPHNFQEVYLDINSEWTLKEFNSVWEALRGKAVYAYRGRMTRLTEQNYLQTFHEAHAARYSLFPIYEISQTEKALIVSKSGHHSPDMDGLRQLKFGKKLDEWVQKRPEPVAFFNLGHRLNPYLKSLREFGILAYAKGDAAELKEMLKSESFPTISENENLLVLEDSRMQIQRDSLPSSGNVEDTGPDHLMRLFVYNKVLKEAGHCFMSGDEFGPEMVKFAESAYVVTPFTSLIVLETEKDYKQSGIEESEGGLGNASTLQKAYEGGKGSVPEPHEWLLILLVLSVLIWTQRHRLPRFHKMRA